MPRGGRHHGLQISLGNRAQILRQRGDAAGALAVMAEQEELCRSIGDAAGVARALAAQGAVLGDQGQLDLALQRFAEHRRVARELGDLRGVAESSISEANTLRELGRRDEAAALAEEAEALLRRLDDEPLLFRVLDLRGRMALEEGRWADAERLANESLLTARSAGVRAGLTLPLGNSSGWRGASSATSRARVPRTPRRRRSRRSSTIRWLGQSHRQTSLLSTSRPATWTVRYVGTRWPNLCCARAVSTGSWCRSSTIGGRCTCTSVMPHRPSPICSRVPRRPGVVGAVQQQHQMLTKAVELLYGAGRTTEAEPVWADLEAACRQLGDQAGLQRAIGERALLLIGRGALDAAAPLLDEQEQICRAIGDQVGLAACVGNRAILLRQQGDLAGSLSCIDEQLALARAPATGRVCCSQRRIAARCWARSAALQKEWPRYRKHGRWLQGGDWRRSSPSWIR